VLLGKRDIEAECAIVAGLPGWVHPEPETKTAFVYG
jgi:hypothetical protein